MHGWRKNIKSLYLKKTINLINYNGRNVSFKILAQCSGNNPKTQIWALKYVAHIAYSRKRCKHILFYKRNKFYQVE